MNAPDDVDDINTPEGLIAGWLEYMAAICDGALESDDITSDEHESLSNYLRFIQEDVESGCCSDAVMNTSSFWGYLHGLQIPSIEKEALSLSSKKAANARYSKEWTPVLQKSLKREYLKKIETKKHWPACKELAKEIYNLKDKTKEDKKLIRTYSRRIDRQITKMHLSK